MGLFFRVGGREDNPILIPPLRRPLVAIVYCEARVEGDRIVYTATCVRCSSVIGDLDKGELMAMVSGEYGSVLCFDCEERSCPVCKKEVTAGDVGSMQRNGVCWFCERSCQALALC